MTASDIVTFFIYICCMKILFFGDYSNLHACLATELRRMGHVVTVISDGGRYMDTGKDILLDRKEGLTGTLKYFYNVVRLVNSIKDYDVVQLINPHFLALRPSKIQFFFDILKKQNRSIFLTLAGNDYHFVNECMNGNMFKFSEFKVGNKNTEFENFTKHGEKWTMPFMKVYAEYIYDNIDGAMSVLPEYDMAARPFLGNRLAFTNIPVDLSYLPFKEMDTAAPVRIFIGMREGMKIQKGTEKLLNLSLGLQKSLKGRCIVECVSNISLKEYLKRMAKSNIVLDQLYSYSPGTNGFQAMALGKVAGTGGQEEFYQYIGETEKRPILSLSPLDENIEERITELIINPEKMREMGIEGRKLVERNNDVSIVAHKFENHWNKILSGK